MHVTLQTLANCMWVETDRSTRYRLSISLEPNVIVNFPTVILNAIKIIRSKDLCYNKDLCSDSKLQAVISNFMVIVLSNDLIHTSFRQIYALDKDFEKEKTWWKTILRMVCEIVSKEENLITGYFVGVRGKVKTKNTI